MLNQTEQSHGELIRKRAAKCSALSAERPGKFCVFLCDGTLYLTADNFRQAELSSTDYFMMDIWADGAPVTVPTGRGPSHAR